MTPGHDVASVLPSAQGMVDGDVLEWTAREGRVLLTFDKDFGELARHEALTAPCGVVLFRIAMPRPPEVATRLLTIIAGRDDWPGHFSVVEPGRVRMRSL